MLALVGVFYPYNRGALFTALVVIYALTSGIAGYTAASFYCQLEGTNWVSIDENFWIVSCLWTVFDDHISVVSQQSSAVRESSKIICYSLCAFDKSG